MYNESLGNFQFPCPNQVNRRNTSNNIITNVTYKWVTFLDVQLLQYLPSLCDWLTSIEQVNGDFDAVHEALLQITTRLRNHFFRDAFPSMNHPSNSGFPDHGPPFPSYMGRRELSPPGRYSSFNRFDAVPPPHGAFHPHDDRPPFMNDRPGFPHPMSERLPSSTPWGPQVSLCLEDRLDLLCVVAEENMDNTSDKAHVVV